MKAEHRHELKTNALADTLGRALHTLKTGPSRHSLLIGVVAVVVAVVVVTGYFIWKGQKEGESALWEKFDAAEGTLDNAANGDEVQAALTKFKELADKNPGTVPATAAQFDRARTLLRQGLERLYSSDRDKALADVKEARDLYAKLAADSDLRKKHPLLGEEAMMGVAKADECLGDFDKARDEYASLARAFPKGVLGKAADERAKYLADNHDRVKELYDKLQEQASPRPAPTESSDKK